MCVSCGAWVAALGAHHSGRALDPLAMALHLLQDMETMPHQVPVPHPAAVSRAMEDLATDGQATAMATAMAITTEAIGSSSININTMATTTMLLEIDLAIHMALANKSDSYAYELFVYLKVFNCWKFPFSFYLISLCWSLHFGGQ